MSIRIEIGDMFAVDSLSGMGWLINPVQAFWAPDGESKYSHAGIITDRAGETFEALWTNRFSRLRAYDQQNIIIARMTEPDAHTKVQAIKEIVKEYEGRHYPWWRLKLHLIPPLARIFNWDGRWVVCSELVARYMYICQARHSTFAGTNPRRLVYEWRHWRNIEIVYEGKMDPGLVMGGRW